MTPWREMWRTFGGVGLMSFGGPAAQIALMHEALVARRKWLSEAEFLRALGFCTLLPGPEAMQLASYAGWRLRGPLGGVLAGLLFVVPGALVVLALSAVYVAYGTVPWVAAAFGGIKAAVLVIVVQAVLRLSGKALGSRGAVALAVAAFLALFVFAVPFPLVVGAAALAGTALRLHKGAAEPGGAPVDWRVTLRTVTIWGAIWWGPLAVILWARPGSILADIAVFFSWLAVVTFGGAYAVLAYMAQVAVETQGWLSAAQMVDGLGLAETTPGPLILVTQFVGFMAGWGAGGWGMALAGAGVALWATFAPCFLWVFAGAPYVERIAGAPRLQSALKGITAAVVGVIANLSLWFSLHVLFARGGYADIGPGRVWAPDWATLDLRAVVLALLAAVLIFGGKRGMATTLLACAGAGIVLGGY